MWTELSPMLQEDEGEERGPCLPNSSGADHDAVERRTKDGGEVQISFCNHTIILMH